MGDMWQHLHSTMFLLKPGPVGEFLEVPEKFTFHNVSIKTAAGGLGGAFKTLFTFHNVSIKTIQPDRRRHIVQPFTFHNVSIKTVTINLPDIALSSFTFHNVSIKTRHRWENGDGK